MWGEITPEWYLLSDNIEISVGAPRRRRGRASAVKRAEVKAWKPAGILSNHGAYRQKEPENPSAWSCEI